MSTVHDHEAWADSLGAWLLDALPEAEAEGFRAHMEICATCRADAESLGAAAAALPASVPPATPPPELQRRVMAIVEREAELLRAAGPEADRPEPRRRRRRLPRLSGLGLRPALALPLALLLLATGAGAGLLGREALDEDRRVVVARVNPQILGASASLELEGDRARLVGEALPPPPKGRVYQVWVDRGGDAPEATSALFAPRLDGSASVDVPGSLDGVRAVMVTDEPRGGSERPTGRIVLTAAPA